LNSWEVFGKLTDVTAYYFLSDINAPVQLSVQIVELPGEKVIWELPTPVRVFPVERNLEDKILLEKVPFPDLAPDGDTRCKAVLLLVECFNLMHSYSTPRAPGGLFR
jgi:hypothetical protein